MRSLSDFSATKVVKTLDIERKKRSHKGSPCEQLAAVAISLRCYYCQLCLQNAAAAPSRFWSSFWHYDNVMCTWAEVTSSATRATSSATPYISHQFPSSFTLKAVATASLFPNRDHQTWPPCLSPIFALVKVPVLKYNIFQLLQINGTKFISRLFVWYPNTPRDLHVCSPRLEIPFVLEIRVN